MTSSVIVWCNIMVLMNTSWLELTPVETLVRGKIVTKTEQYYIVDFSEYAKKQGYLHLNNPKLVKKEFCVKE